MVLGIFEFLPDKVNSLKYREVSEDSQDPENRFHPLEDGPCGEEDNAFCSLHEPDTAWNLQCLCLGSDVRDQDGAHTDKRSEDHDIRLPPFQVGYEDGKKKEEIRISVQNGIQEAAQGGCPSQFPGNNAIKEIEESGEDDRQSSKEPDAFDNEEGSCKG